MINTVLSIRIDDAINFYFDLIQINWQVIANIDDTFH